MNDVQTVKSATLVPNKLYKKYKGDGLKIIGVDVPDYVVNRDKTVAGLVQLAEFNAKSTELYDLAIQILPGKL